MQGKDTYHWMTHYSDTNLMAFEFYIPLPIKELPQQQKAKKKKTKKKKTTRTTTKDYPGCSYISKADNNQ